MMTEEERKQAFIVEYNVLVVRYGVMLVPAVSEQLSTALPDGRVRIMQDTTHELALVANWQAPPDEKPA